MFCILGYFCICVWTSEQHGIDLMWLNRTTLGSCETLWLYIQFRCWLLISKYQYTQLSLACHGRYVFNFLILKCTSRLFQSLMEPWHRKIGAIGISFLLIGSYLFAIMIYGRKITNKLLFLALQNLERADLKLLFVNFVLFDFLNVCFLIFWLFLYWVAFFICCCRCFFDL